MSDNTNETLNSKMMYSSITLESKLHSLALHLSNLLYSTRQFESDPTPNANRND